MSGSTERSTFKPYYQIPYNPEGRRLVIPDIHGCSKTFHALLQRIALSPEDQLFLLGDYVDRGPDSKGVLDSIIALKASGYQVYALRGNHEQFLIDAIAQEENQTLLWYKEDWILQLCDHGQSINQEYKDFLLDLPYYFELPDFYLVHAGFNFQKPHFLMAYDDMLWIRHFIVDEEQLGDRRLIHGHTPTDLQEIKDMIKHEKRVCLDNGAVFHHLSKHFGHLLCLDLDNTTLTLQENIDR